MSAERPRSPAGRAGAGLASLARPVTVWTDRWIALLGDMNLRVLTYRAPQDSCCMEALEHRVDFFLGIILSLEVLHQFGTPHLDLAAERFQHLESKRPTAFLDSFSLALLDLAQG